MTRSEDGLLFPLYRGATMLLGPLAKPFLHRRLRRGKENGARLRERLGHPGRDRPSGPLVWMHGASVGEGLALLPLIERLAERGLAILITTGTVTSADVLQGRLPAGTIHQFLPLDVPMFMDRFFDHWRPDLVLLAESELWPNLLFAAGRRDTPVMLVNARLSARSHTRWLNAPRLIEAMLARTTLCLAQTAEDAKRLTALGALGVKVTGNVKYDGPPPPADPHSVDDMAARIGKRPVWVAASTHADEEAIVLAAHGRVMRGFPDLLTIVAPRKVERGPGLVEQAAQMGLRAGLRSKGQSIEPDTQVFVADTMGELGLFYRLSPIVFVGKSLTGGGGQNPIEPAKLDSAILHGGQVSNFVDVYRLLDEGGGALAVVDEDGLVAALSDLLADGAKLCRMRRASAATVAAQSGATERTLAAIKPYLAAFGGGA